MSDKTEKTSISTPKPAQVQDETEAGVRASADPAIKADDVPAKIDHYEIEGELARGGMGVVYSAHEPSLGRRVALKVVNKKLITDEGVLARFDQEARAAADLKHANVVSIYFRGTYDGAPYFAMELVEGRSLSDVARDGPLEPKVALGYLLQTCKGLQAADDKGLIHRDIKPANLMLTNRGEIKITDFGLAKALESDADLTHSGLVVGTPHYMSPEQAQGRDLDCRADIYSLGATFYHLLCSKRPFERSSITGVLLAHVNEPVPPLKQNCPNIPAPVCATIEKMLDKRPHNRFQNYTELIEHVESLLASLSGSVSHATTKVVSKPNISETIQAESAPTGVSEVTPSSETEQASVAIQCACFFLAFFSTLILSARTLRFWDLTVGAGMYPWLYFPDNPVSVGAEIKLLAAHVIPRGLIWGLILGVIAWAVQKRLEEWRTNSGFAATYGTITSVALVNLSFAVVVISRGHPQLPMALPFGEKVGTILNIFTAAAIVGLMTSPSCKRKHFFQVFGLSACRISLDIGLIAILWRPLGFGSNVFEMAYAIGDSVLAGSFLFGATWLLLLLPVSLIIGRAIVSKLAHEHSTLFLGTLVASLVVGYSVFAQVLLVTYHPPDQYFLAGVGGFLSLMALGWFHWKVLAATEVQHEK